MDTVTRDVITEFSRNLVEYLKHLTTLATGSIVLQIGFVEKVFPHPKWKGFIVVSILSLTASIVTSVIAYTVIVIESGNPERQRPLGQGRPEMLGMGAVVGSWVGFLLGIIAMVVFALRNLFTI